jgi:hypothetical protein
LPINVFDPVVANDAVLAFNELVYDSKVPKRVEALPVNVSIEALNEFSDAVCANIDAVNEFCEALNEFTLALNEFSDDVKAANELVNVNTVESSPSNRSALEAYDAEAIEPEIVMLPEVMMLPVTVSEPEIMGEFSIILLF